MADDPDDPGGQWLTLAEIAQARGISEQSAGRTIRRKRWRRQPDNQGTVRFLVPDSGHNKSVRPRKDAATVTALLATIETLRTALAREQGRADKAEADVRTAEAARDAARQDARTAQDRLAELERANEAARARRRWARLRAAWRGE
jgi:hypothetical protein